ncbi:MAG: hypothetical protein CMF59_08815 [Leptospiraceae bacterium]|nr:hypothetical protein [Leptospiraceae bacterium]
MPEKPDLCRSGPGKALAKYHSLHICARRSLNEGLFLEISASQRLYFEFRSRGAPGAGIADFPPGLVARKTEWSLFFESYFTGKKSGSPLIWGC